MSMSPEFKKRFHFILGLLACVIFVCIIYRVNIVYQYNVTQHSTQGLTDTADSYMDLHFRGGETSSWEKINLGIEGSVFDGYLYNNSRSDINTWNLRINIKDECWLNQFWNGEVEVHQHAGTKDEISQRLNLADYDIDEIELDYVVDGVDLLIPLQKGDYVIYCPSVELREMPVDANSNIVVGMIFYYKDDIDLSDYNITYYYKMKVMEGSFVIVIVALIVLEMLLLTIYIVTRYTYFKAEKEMGLRKSVIAGMTDLYAILCIIDLVHNTIISVGTVDEDDDLAREDMQADEKVKLFFEKTTSEEYKSLIEIFTNLSTMSSRLKRRNSIALEYESSTLGWCRVRFIAMERTDDKPIEKVLFAVQQINEEKQEIDTIRGQIEKVRNENREKRNILESVSTEIQTPLRMIIGMDDHILQETTEENIRNYAAEIKTTGEMLLSMVSSTLEYSLLKSGKIKISPEVYSFRQLLNDIEYDMGVALKDKNIEFKSNISACIPDTLFGDGPKLKEILLYLTSRAVDDLSSGEISLRVFGKLLGNEKIHLLFSVQATGSMKEAQDTEIGIGIARRLIALMNSELKTAVLYQGRDLYFEIEQEIPVPVDQQAGGEEGIL